LTAFEGQIIMSDNKTTPEQTVIFVHIPKAAGTTLDYIINRNLPQQSIYTMLKDSSLDDFKNLSDLRKSQIRLVRGHIGFGLHRFLPKPCAYFTLLREPIERTISYYYYIRCATDHWWHDRVNAENMSLFDFINLRLDASADNGQTRLLSGLETGYEVEFGKCDRQMLEAAKINLREHFTVVGLVEEFDATLLLLQRGFGWRKLAYVKQNVSTNRPKRREIPQATLDAIARVNSLDAELYEYAKTLFEEQVRQHGASFAREVRDFQIANRRLNPFIRLYWEARKVSVRSMVRKWIRPRHNALV
jgi:hypothetical protein